MDDISRYLDVYFYQNTDDYYLKGSDRFKSERIEAKFCEEKDFGPDADSIEFFKGWAGYNLICPDMPDGESLQLRGDASSMVNKNIAFRVDRCGTTIKTQNCASSREIDDYIYDFQVDSWSVFEKIDFTKYH